MGSWSVKGRFILESWRLRNYKVPTEQLNLSPYVSSTIPIPNTPEIHSVLDYFKNADLEEGLKRRCLERAHTVVDRVGAIPNK
jgi:hypothetical protein